MGTIEPVGEAGALAELHLRLGGLASGGPGLAALLFGPVGAGKTHAAQALRQGAPFRSLTVRATQPLSELAHLFLHDAAPRWVRAALGRLVRRERLGEGDLALALVAALTTAAPVVVQVEDLHEAVGVRRTLWAALAQGVRRSRGVALLGTSLEPLPPFETVEVPPLAGAELGALIHGHLGAVLPDAGDPGAVPRGATEWIAARTLGNPLFTLEYVRFLTRHGFLRGDGPRWFWTEPPPATLPENLVSLIGHAVARAALSPAARAALHTLAALPGEATAPERAQCAGLPAPEWEAALRELGAGGLVRGGQIVHPLYAEVVRLRLSPDERRGLVRRAAQALEFRPDVAVRLLDLHPLPPGEALDLLRRAARHARAHGDEPAAADFAARSVPLLHGELRLTAALEAARALRLADPRRALALAHDAHTHAPHRPEAGSLLAELLARRGSREQALEVTDTLPPGAWEERTRLRALAHASVWDFGGVLREWEATPPGGRGNLALRLSVARALLHLGRPGEAAALVPPADPTAPDGTGADLSSTDRAALLLAWGMLDHERGEFARALDRTSGAVALLRPLGPGRGLAEALMQRAWLGWGQLETRPARADAEEAAHVAEALDHGVLAALARVSRAAPLLDDAEYEAAEEALHDGLAAADRAEGGGALRDACRAHLAFLYAEWGWVTASARAARLSLAYAEHLLDPARPGQPQEGDRARGLALAAHAHARHGDPRHALVLAQEAVSLARPRGQERAVARAEVALGVASARLRRPEDAEHFLREGTGRLARLGLPGWAERFALELDAVRGDADRAGERLGPLLKHGGGHARRVAERLFPERRVATPALPPTAATRLLVLGPFALETGQGRHAFPAQRGRGLLALLLGARLAGQPDVPQHDLTDALYPGQPEAQAKDALQQLVRRVRLALGKGAVWRTGQGYALGDVTSDAEEYLHTHDLRLWRGPYLEDVGEGGSPGVRERLGSQLRADLETHAEHDPDVTVRALRALLHSEPYDEAHLRFALATLRRLGRTRTARELYAAARTRFAELGHPLPDDWQTYLGE